VKGRWTYLYRAVDSRGKTIDFLLSGKRDAAAARRFFRKALKQSHTVSQERSQSTRTRLSEREQIDEEGGRVVALRTSAASQYSRMCLTGLFFETACEIVLFSTDAQRFPSRRTAGKDAAQRGQGGREAPRDMRGLALDGASTTLSSRPADERRLRLCYAMAARATTWQEQGRVPALSRSL